MGAALKACGFGMVLLAFGATAQGHGGMITPSTGGIRGVILDGRRCPVAGVLVRCIDEHGRTHTASTDQKGFIRLGMLAPGYYTITISKEGLATCTHPRMRVKAGQWLLPPYRWDLYTWDTGPELRLEWQGPGGFGAPVYDPGPGQCSHFTREELEEVPR